MTQPTFDMVSNGPSDFLREALSVGAGSQGTIALPVGAYARLGPMVEVGDERLLLTGVDSQTERDATTLSAEAPIGSTTITVNNAASFNADPDLGIVNPISIGLNAAEAGTVLAVAGNVLTLEHALAATWAAASPVQHRNTGTGASEDSTELVKTVRAVGAPAQPRNTRVTKVYTPAEFETTAAQALPVLLSLTVRYSGATFDRQMTSTMVGRTTADKAYVRWSTLLPLPAGCTFTYQVSSPPAGFLTGSPAELTMWGVADAAGVPLALPTYFAAVASTTGNPTNAQGDVIPGAKTLTFDAVSEDYPAEPEATIASGRVSVLTAGWYSLDLTLY